ncbi:unnamed protein product, partial [Musa textilis]
MEGLIPFLYRAFVRDSNGGQSPMRNILFNESPSASYMRLPGDSASAGATVSSPENRSSIKTHL